jgi:serine-type D-Ala-D-Ala carboxypeptidase/endopeptidase (penicillin-binding protein 4)
MHRATPAAVALTVLLATAATAPATGVPVGSVASPSATVMTETAGTPTTVPTVASNARVTQVLRSRTKSRVLGTRFTMTVWDTATSSYIYKRRSTSSLRGASTTKILTAVGVLNTLGPEHRFPTVVRAGAGPDEVVLVGGGDPLLTSADLRGLAAATAAALGIAPTPAPDPSATPDPTPDPTPPPVPTRTIVVHADDSLFGGKVRPSGWRSSYLPREVRPVGAFARDDNKVWDSTRDAGTYFAGALAKLGVQATYAGEATAAPDAPVLATFDGHSVAESVARMLLVSDNDTAEMLFRQVAVGRGLPATWKGARTALKAVLRELRIPLTGVRIIDGSGLSLTGRLTAGALTSALNRALSPDHPELSGLRGWLPVAGRTGTLKAAYKRFTSKPSRCAAGLVQAKTGTLADAISLAGYAQGADGQTKIFVSIVNRRPTRYSRLTTRVYVDRAVSSVTGCW